MTFGNCWWHQVIAAAVAGWVLLAGPAPAAAHTYSRDEIIGLMNTERVWRCLVNQPDTWLTFAQTQHDDTTVALLLELYRQPQSEVIHARALECLSYQRRDELLALWVAILHQREDDGPWPSALQGLTTINSPEANAALLELLTDSSTPATLLSQACEVASWRKLPGARAAIESLRHHPSAAVRHAAFRALWKLDEEREGALRESPGDDSAAVRAAAAPESAQLHEYRQALLRDALTDSDGAVLCWALHRINDKSFQPLVPLLFNCQDNPDAAVRTAADGALRYFLPNSTDGDDSDFDAFRQALMNNQWDYARSPQLAMQYGIRLELNGQLAEAAEAYEMSDQGFPADASHAVYGNYSGATALYRLMQVKRKLGDVPAARAVLRRMVEKYPANFQVYAEDRPLTAIHGWHMSSTVGELAEQLEQYFASLPLAGSVTFAQAASADTFARFTVAIRNITDSPLILKCARQTHQRNPVLVPTGRPSVTIDGRGMVNFNETGFLADTGETVTLAPGASFTFAASLPVLLEPGPHGIDFVLEATCILPSGGQWSGYVVANSLTVIDGGQER